MRRGEDRGILEGTRPTAPGQAGGAGADPVRRTYRPLPPASYETEAAASTRAPGISGAGPDIATSMAAREPPWPEAVPVDTSGALESAVTRAPAAVRPWGCGQAPVFRRRCREPG